MASLVASNRLPEGKSPVLQLQFLQGVVVSCIPWAREMLKSSRAVLDKCVYTRYLQLCIASLYTTSAQGRIGAIRDLKLASTDALLRDGYVMTDSFKTHVTMGYQAISLSPVSSELVRGYRDFIRPRIPVPSTSEFLFVNYGGEYHKDLGREITRFFSHCSATQELHMSSTGFRTLVSFALCVQHFS